MADNVWVIGVHMTKFAQHKDKDALDLGRFLFDGREVRTEDLHTHLCPDAGG